MDPVIGRFVFSFCSQEVEARREFGGGRGCVQDWVDKVKDCVETDILQLD